MTDENNEKWMSIIGLLRMYDQLGVEPCSHIPPSGVWRSHDNYTA